MMRATLYKGFYFVEGRPKDYVYLSPVSVEVGGIFTPGQLRSLDDVKSLMAQKAREVGGNAVVDFKYGQRSVGFFRSLLNLDDVVWYGSGTIASITIPSKPSK
jgi:hypothetical protein